jgi:hypothetical protein
VQSEAAREGKHASERSERGSVRHVRAEHAHAAEGGDARSDVHHIAPCSGAHPRAACASAEWPMRQRASCGGSCCGWQRESAGPGVRLTSEGRGDGMRVRTRQCKGCRAEAAVELAKGDERARGCDAADDGREADGGEPHAIQRSRVVHSLPAHPHSMARREMRHGVVAWRIVGMGWWRGASQCAAQQCSSHAGVLTCPM